MSACLTPSTCSTAPQHYCYRVGSEQNVAVAIKSLPAGVLLTGTPTVEEYGSSDLTITQAAINSSAVTLFGVAYAAGKVVQFHRAGGVAGRLYRVRITASTDASPADVVVVEVTHEVAA